MCALFEIDVIIYPVLFSSYQHCSAVAPRSPKRFSSGRLLSAPVLDFVGRRTAARAALSRSYYALF